MKIKNLKIDHVGTPLGFLIEDGFSVSYQVINAKGKKEISCSIQVSENIGFENPIYDSGILTEILPVYPVNMSLKPRTRYYVKVTSVSDAEEICQETTWFETGKMKEPWIAKWIGMRDKRIKVPVIHRRIRLDKEFISARAYVGCAGVYVFSINGKKVGDEYLTPYCNDYTSWMQVITHDITKHLQKGENELNFMLSDGWYKGSFTYERVENIYGKELSIIAEIHVKYEDGSEEVLKTDVDWEVNDSVYETAGIYDGVHLNYKKHCPTSSPVTLIDMETLKLKDRLSLPVKAMEVRGVESVFVTPKGEHCIDLGQNITGWLRIDTSQFADKDFKIQYFEVLTPDGNVYTENLRTAKAEFIYETDGNARVVEPEFTFYGFRYAKIVGLDEIPPKAFVGIVVYSQMEQTGNIMTSNALVNRLFQNALWGHKDNFLDVPTDCPQRDERLGWTGDAQIFSGTAYYNMESAAFFRKYLYDMRKEQEKMNGGVPVVVPCFSTGHPSTAMLKSCVAGWGDAAVVIPWNSYLHTGDKRMLKEQYPGMKGWVEYIRKRDDGSHLWNSDFQLGDWLALDNPNHDVPFGMTPTTLVASAYYLYSTLLTAKAARTLGYEKDGAMYDALAVEICAAIRREFLTPSGRVASDTQTADVLALKMEFAKDTSYTIQSLSKKILTAYGGYLSTGFLGTAYLCSVLSENNKNDIAYKLLLNKNYPGWLYEVEKGATTVWERWNSIHQDGSLGAADMNSFNHYAYGAVMEWMYQYPAGLKPIAEAAGFQKIHYAPKPDPQLQWLEASYDSISGKYVSYWEIREEGLFFRLKVPFNAKALLFLPDVPEIIKMNNETIVYSEGMEVAAGEYEIEYVPIKQYYIVYSWKSDAKLILENAKLAAVLTEKIPAVQAIPEIMLHMFQGSIEGLLLEIGIVPDAAIRSEIETGWKTVRSWG